MIQVYMVSISCMMGWFLSRLPEWTTWALLAAVACYDVVAVLAPRGPLKQLVEESQRRQEPLPALVYDSHVFKLGLGDFIFYSVLVGRAAMDSTVAATVCLVAVVVGLCVTLVGLGLLRAALPALPFSVGLGIVFYVLARFLLVPYVTEVAGLG
eukprot:RCo048911